MTKCILNDKNIKLLNHIYKNNIMDIINSLDTDNINLDAIDDSSNTILMQMIEKLRAKPYVVFEKVCPFVKCVIYDVNDVCSHKNMLRFKSSINVKNKFGESALIIAIKNLSHLQNADITNYDTIFRLIKTLMQYGADVNAQDLFGNTALMYCAKVCMLRNIKQTTKIIKYMIDDNRTDLSIKNKNGNTTFDLFLYNNYITLNILHLFLDKNAHISNNECNAKILERLGDLYNKNKCYEDMKKCYISAAQKGLESAKYKMFHFYANNYRIEDLTPEICVDICMLFKKKASFALIYKSPYYHKQEECPICMEDKNNIVTLPCFETHIICLDCINKLTNKKCVFCNETFNIEASEFKYFK